MKLLKIRSPSQTKSPKSFGQNEFFERKKNIRSQVKKILTEVHQNTRSNSKVKDNFCLKQIISCLKKGPRGFKTRNFAVPGAFVITRA